MKGKNHGYNIGEASVVSSDQDRIGHHLLSTSATISAVVANLIDISARRRSSGLLQPATFAFVNNPILSFREISQGFNWARDILGLQYLYNGEQVKKLDSMQLK